MKVDLDRPQTTIDSAPSDPAPTRRRRSPSPRARPAPPSSAASTAAPGAACTSPELGRALADGSHDFEVRATDGAGTHRRDARLAHLDGRHRRAADDDRASSRPIRRTTTPRPSSSSPTSRRTFECRARRRRLDAVHEPRDRRPARRRQPHLRGTGDRRRRQHRPDSRLVHLDGGHGRAGHDLHDRPRPPRQQRVPVVRVRRRASPARPSSVASTAASTGMPCASPAIVGPLVDGSHTFDVRATDPAGQPGRRRPASHTWTWTRGAPPISITQPSGFVNASDADPYTVRATSPDADVAGVEFFSCSDASARLLPAAPGSRWAPTRPPRTRPRGPSIADGNRALRAVATDTASNIGSAVIDVTIDRTVPDTTIDSAPSDPSSDTSPSFALLLERAGRHLRVPARRRRVDGVHDPAGLLGPRRRQPHVPRRGRPTRQATSTRPPSTYSWTVDTTAPQTTIDSSPSNPSSSAAPSLRLLLERAGLDLRVPPRRRRLDGAARAPRPTRASPTAATPSPCARPTRPATRTRLQPRTPGRSTRRHPAAASPIPVSTCAGRSPSRASPSDTGVGVQSVDFQVSPANAGSWSSIDVDTTSPYGAAGTRPLVADGLYDLRVVVTDNAGNSSRLRGGRGPDGGQHRAGRRR